MKRFIAVLAILLLPPVLAFAQSTVTKDKRSQKLELYYYDKLNEWVIHGGQAEEVQSSVVETCGKLIMLIASPDERIEFISTQEEEFNFRVDVCTNNQNLKTRKSFQKYVMKVGILFLATYANGPAYANNYNALEFLGI